MSRTIQSKKRIESPQGNAVAIADGVSANWQIYDPEGHYRRIVEAVRTKYSDRFHKNEIKTYGDFVKFLLRHADTCVELLRPEPIAS